MRTHSSEVWEIWEAPAFLYVNVFQADSSYEASYDDNAIRKKKAIITEKDAAIYEK